ncbi:MAG TPA: NAD(P)-dependent alcohol dehydrogenase [Thermodesulfovibrionales bacterium]|nr:NAD(P)-dependent alcohol dehydrogenase [Thermodesulfovibrionales bacterium]
MKAVVIRKFGPPDVMNIEEVDKPAISCDQILVRVYYSSVNPVDWKIRNGSLKFLIGSRFPMVLGFDVAGEVIETGTGVTRFRKGDRVFGMLHYRQRGAYAEYIAAKEDYLAIIPENLDFKEAAAVPLAGLTAYQALHYKANIKSGDTVLVNGASGGVGSFAVQIAMAAGASVTAVCGTDNLERVKALGVDKVTDYRRQDFIDLPDQYDIIFDAAGKRSFFQVRRNLKAGGRYVTTLPNVANIFSSSLIPFMSLFGYRKKSSLINVHPSGLDLNSLGLLIKQGRLFPLIDQVFPLEKIREAHTYSETEHARGKIVIEIL